MGKKEFVPVTNDEIIDAILRPIEEAILSEGITHEYLAKKIKAEIEAEKTQVVKVKGRIPKARKSRLPENVKVIAETKEETLLSINRVDWGTRQRGRIDAHRLKADYPAEKQEIEITEMEKLGDRLTRAHRRLKPNDD